MPNYYNKNGIRIDIRTREELRHIPHVHINCAEYDASVDLHGNILIGNIPPNKIDEALEWVKANSQYLADEYRRIHNV